MRDSPTEILRIDLAISFTELVYGPDYKRGRDAGEQILATLARDGG